MSPGSIPRRIDARSDVSFVHLSLVVLGLLVSGSCTSRPSPPAKHDDVVVWHKLGAWSGRGDAQTGSFQSDSGGRRGRWETPGNHRHHGERVRLTLQNAV